MMNKPTNKKIKMSSFKSSENIQNIEGGPDRSVSDTEVWIRKFCFTIIYEQKNRILTLMKGCNSATNLLKSDTLVFTTQPRFYQC